jgi:heme exporter protein C
MPEYHRPAVPASTSQNNAPFAILLAVSAVGFLAVPFLIVGAPIEPTMGIVQKIFYFHAPIAWLLLLSTGVCAAGSIAYLFAGSERGDRLAVASAELGVVFGLCTLVTGPLWARVAWGVFWTWDARLTSSLLLWLMLIAYVLARRYGGPGARKLSAALALFAAADAPLVYVSVNVWRTIHPKTTVVPSLSWPMARVFLASLLLFTIFFGVLLVLRLRLEKARAALMELEIAYEDARETRS